MDAFFEFVDNPSQQHGSSPEQLGERQRLTRSTAAQNLTITGTNAFCGDIPSKGSNKRKSISGYLEAGNHSGSLVKEDRLVLRSRFCVGFPVKLADSNSAKKVCERCKKKKETMFTV